KSKKALEPLLKKSNVELLPLICNEASLYIINILGRFKPEEVLDMEKSEVKRLPSGGIMYVSKHCFNKKAIAGMHIFDVQNLIVCDDEFKKTVEDSGLEGLCFRLLWQCDDNE
ncbi:MAG: hypothetical protein IJR59_06015, partial [Firmicutes bacterium]|nr:hypothetical protein [Bacillota bacterium]